ncbi:transposase, partial [Staphylococcus saprophyticus]
KYKVHGRDGLQDGRGKGKPKSILTPEEQKEAEIQALKSRNKILEMENKVLKKYQEIEREMINQKTSKSSHTKRLKR